MSRIASVKFKKALPGCTRAASSRVLAFCVMAACLVFTLAVTAANLRLTYVTDSHGARQVVLTSESDPARVMSLSGIEAEEGDEVYYTAFAGSLASLNIERAFSVTIEADGQEYPVKMVVGTVADALERAGITLEGDDYTEPALSAMVTAGSKIEVHRVEYQDKVETQAVPYDTEYVYTSLYFRNTNRATTLQHGSEGQQTVTTRERWVDGELENSVVTDVTTTVEPTDHVVKTYGAGAPVSPLTGPDGTTNAPASYRKVLTGKATGYHPRPFRGAFRGRDGHLAHVRYRHPARRFGHLWLPAGRALLGGRGDGGFLGAPAPPRRGPDAPLGRGGVRGGHHRLRPLEEPLSFHRLDGHLGRPR